MTPFTFVIFKHSIVASGFEPCQTMGNAILNKIAARLKSGREGNVGKEDQREKDQGSLKALR